jgi:hypothetical protein
MTEFIKYPKIYAVGHEETMKLLDEGEIIIQEKMDGGNFRFMFNDGNVVFGSRTQSLTSSTGEEVNVNKNFRRCLDFVRDKVKEHPDLIKEWNRHIFFGECMVKHSMDYDWKKIPPFLGFDVYDIAKEKMMSCDEAQELFKNLGLDFVPIIDLRDAKGINEINENMIPVSKYAALEGALAEGIVFKNYHNGIFAKIVSTRFKEKNAEVFGLSPKFQEDDTGKIVARYGTNARIEKMIFALIDEGQKLDMKMMKDLSHRVFKDIWDEEWYDLMKYSEIKPREMKRLLARRCAAILKQMMVNNLLNQKNA